MPRAAGKLPDATFAGTVATGAADSTFIDRRQHWHAR
jgi:hypothetical protein